MTEIFEICKMKKQQFKRLKIIFTLFMVFGVSWLSAQNIESASRGEKIEDIKACLAKGADPNFKYEKQTILCHSINRKSHEITIFLANAKGIRINEYSIRPEPELSWKFTALMKAAEFPDLVKLFLDKGAGIDLQDDWLRWNGELDASGGNTPLMLSVAEFTESAKILIDRGAKLEIQNRSGQTALMKSVVNTEIAKILIDKGAKLDVQDKSGLTALMYAAEKYNDVVKLLLDKGANIVIRSANQMKSLDILSGISASHVSPNALDIAATHGNIEGAKLIMAKAVSLGVKDEVIYSALFWAVIYDQVAMAKYLLDEGAKIEGTDELGSYTPLMQTSLYEMVELLVKRGANVNAKSKFNYSPLYKAVFNFIEGKRKEKDCYKIINLLLEKGANPDTQDGNGVTPLMTAVQKIDVAKLLVAKGANININLSSG